jgi:hypothetical protein
VIFVVDVILKMGIPVFMADNEGFREWLGMEVSISIVEHMLQADFFSDLVN